MPAFASLFIFALAGTTAAHSFPSTSSHTFTLAAKKISPDGFTRSAALVNGQFPGPVLTAIKGQRLSVDVVNRLADPTMRQSTSIHWHGLFQAHNSENDGPSFVTQCPISPYHHYRYEIELGDQTGTYWYHSHLRTQYVDGIRGALVIYDPHDPQRGMYDVDDENTIITLADWYQKPAEALFAAWLGPNGSEPVPDAGLINGVGRFKGGPAVRWARINVVRGKRYRFRLIGMSADGFFDFSISGHEMSVIEADGIAHKPYCVDAINVAPGQRYSVVVKANQDVGNYWIRATQTVIAGQTRIDSNPQFDGNLTYAVLHYAGASNSDPRDPPPTTLPPGAIEFEEHNMVPLEKPGLPGGENPSDLHVFHFNFTIGSPNGDIWTVNGVQYQAPKIPTLLNILANGFRNDTQFAPGERTFVLPRNATIEVVFNGGTNPPVGPGHSFHLHGHSFDVVQGLTGPPNFINPPRRDTVRSSGGDVRIRFRTDNPGPWFLHCHIDWHLEAGLAVVFAEDPASIASGPQATKPNADWQQLCKIYDSLKPSQQ